MRTTFKDIVQHVIVSVLSAPIATFLISLGFWVFLILLSWLAKYPMTWIVGQEATLSFAEAMAADKAYGIIYALVVTLILIEDFLMILMKDYLFLTKLRINQMVHEGIHGVLFGKLSDGS